MRALNRAKRRKSVVDPDAVRIGVDPAVLGPETEEKIGDFNRLGRELCERWLSHL